MNKVKSLNARNMCFRDKNCVIRIFLIYITNKLKRKVEL